MRTFFVLVLLITSACSEETQRGSVESSGKIKVLRSGRLDQADRNSTVESNRFSKTLANIVYDFQFFNALDYLDITGRNAEKEDVKSLSDETVIVISFTTANGKDILDNSAMNSDDIQLYLTGAVSQDLVIEQTGSDIEFLGCQPAANGSRKDKMGVMLFVRGVKPDKDFSALFHDQLFNNELIRIPKHNFL